MGAVELRHHLLHRVVHTQDGGWLRHQLSHREMLIEFGTEHHMTDLGDIHLTEEVSRLVEHR